MTLIWLKERLKDLGCKMYHEQVSGIRKKFGQKKKINCQSPIASQKDYIAASLKEEGFFILHSNGDIDKVYKDGEVNFFGIYVWVDTEYTNVILAYV